MTRERVIIYVEEVVYKKLLDEAEKRGIKNTKLVREIIDDYYRPKEINKYEFLDDGCNLRDYLTEEETPTGKQYGEGFYCLKKAPTLIKLGSGIESVASKICGKCIIRDEALKDSKILKEQQKKGIKLKMPYCTKGGIPNEDLTEMYCPEIGGRNRPIDEKKKKTDYIPCRLAGKNNANCVYLKHKTVVTGLKEKEGR